MFKFFDSGPSIDGELFFQTVFPGLNSSSRVIFNFGEPSGRTALQKLEHRVQAFRMCQPASSEMGYPAK